MLLTMCEFDGRFYFFFSKTSSNQKIGFPLKPDDVIVIERLTKDDHFIIIMISMFYSTDHQKKKYTVKIVSWCHTQDMSLK